MSAMTPNGDEFVAPKMNKFELDENEVEEMYDENENCEITEGASAATTTPKDYNTNEGI